MNKHPDAEYVDGFVERMLTIHNLERVDPTHLNGTMELHDELGRPELYERCLRQSLENVEPTDKLALIWCLYLQTDDGVNWAIRERLLKSADALLDAFFNYFFEYEEYLRLYVDAVRALQESHLQLKPRDQSFGDRQAINSWLLLPVGANKAE